MDRRNAASEVSGRSRSQHSQRSTGIQRPRDASQEEFADAIDGSARREDDGGAEPKDSLGWPTTPGAIHRSAGAMVDVGGDTSLNVGRERIRPLVFSPDATTTTGSPGLDASVSSVEEVLARFKQQMDADAQAARQRDAASSQAALAAAAKGLEQVSNSRFAAQQSQIDEVKERTTKIEAEHKAMFAQIAVLQEKLGAHERGAPSTRLDAADDDRTPNPTFLKFRTMVDVTVADVVAKVQELTLGAKMEQGAPGQVWEVIGERRTFAIQFRGTDALASARAKTLYQYTKVGGPGGRYLPIKMAGSDAFLDPDKSPKTESTEAAGRRLRKVVAEAYPQLNVRLIHDEAFVTIDHVPAVRVFSPSPDEVSLEWHSRFLHPDVDRAHVAAAFDNAFSVGRSRWRG